MALRLKEFREVYGAQLSREESYNLWGSGLSDEFLRTLPKKQVRNNITQRKLEIARNLVSKISSPGVKYIGISGSVAANTPNEEDDIDLFIVVNDNMSWILRIYFKFRLGKDVVWYGQEDQKDKACINYICEVRGLTFPNSDIFTFNEITLLKGIYREDYYDRILSSNRWLFKKYYLEDRYGDKGSSWDTNIILKSLMLPINFIFFCVQIMYMFLMGHEPDIGRLLKGFKNGRIEHFPEQFRIEKIENFNST